MPTPAPGPNQLLTAPEATSAQIDGSNACTIAIAPSPMRVRLIALAPFVVPGINVATVGGSAGMATIG
ncbi:MAG TPA: hypothetical protein VF898_00280 [Chloroflexota bacterium]